MDLADIEKIIKTAIPQSEVHVLDPNNDGRHLQAIVVSAAFAGLPLVKQHQMVMRPLKDALAGSLHALAVKTFTPPRWTEVRKEFGF